ncbi:MAG: T9SS C-terminal target domain-containing protein [Bacteroidota bacterium]
MKSFLLLIVLCIAPMAGAQEFPFRVKLDSIQIPELGGLQSFAVGQHNGKWLIVGGRLDGLHRRQPFAAFDLAGHNNQLIVVDPISKQKWTRNLLELDTNLREQLSSTNMQFVQKEKTLYLIGGYGISKEKDDHITFPYLTTIDLEKTIEAVIQNRSIQPHMQQLYDEHFAVTGGKLLLMGNELALVGGHRFDGRYHPMNGPTFVQEYTNSVTFFEIEQLADRITILNIRKIENEKLLHRRDFNVAPTQLKSGQQALISFSGVFQLEENQPYLFASLITKDTVVELSHFSQYYNHYHCANVAFWDNKSNTSFHLFFGGIAQYFDSSGVLVTDNEIPFTRSISLVTKNSENRMVEYLLPAEMPSYLGAASEFILDPSITTLENELVGLHQLKGDSILLGYIFGGINSTAANIFWTNTGAESSASQMVYPVYLLRGATNAKKNPQSDNSLYLQVFPKPLSKEIVVNFNYLNPKLPVQTVLTDKNNKIVAVKKWKKVKMGPNTFYWKVKAIKKHVGGNIGEYTFTLVQGNLEWGEKVEQLMIVK